MTLNTNSWRRAVVAFMLALVTAGVGALVAVPQDTPSASNQCWQEFDDSCCNVNGVGFQGVRVCEGGPDEGGWLCNERKIVFDDRLKIVAAHELGSPHEAVWSRQSWDEQFNTKMCAWQDLLNCGTFYDRCPLVQVVNVILCDDMVKMWEIYCVPVVPVE